MKKVFVGFAALLFLTVSAVAADSPIDKGAVTLEGDIFFRSQSGDVYENADGDAFTTIEAMPSVGYFVAPGFLIGGVMDITSQSQGDASQTLWSAGPMVGYYFNTDASRTEVKGAFYPYLKAFFQYGGYSNGTDLTTTMFGGMGGVAFMISSAVAADFAIMFSSDSWKWDDAPAGVDDSESGTTLQVGVGISAFLWD